MALFEHSPSLIHSCFRNRVSVKFFFYVGFCHEKLSREFMINPQKGINWRILRVNLIWLHNWSNRYTFFVVYDSKACITNKFSLYFIWQSFAWKMWMFKYNINNNLVPTVFSWQIDSLYANNIFKNYTHWWPGDGDWVSVQRGACADLHMAGCRYVLWPLCIHMWYKMNFAHIQ